MSLPNYRLAAQQPQQAQSLTAGSPVSFNILKDRLRASPGGGQMGGQRQDEVKANPFTQNQYGNNAFNPQRIGSKPMSTHGVAKPPKAPEKPLQPYMRYSKKVWDTVKNQNPEMKMWEVGKMIGGMWKDLPDAEKQEFVDDFESEKQEYEKVLAVYKGSPSYITYMQAKANGSPIIDDPEPRGVKMAERRIDIQPAEDEDDPDDGLSVKHVSHARFLRNHRLINDIFSDNVMPDVRSVVTTARMQTLKRQVNSLTMHQKKLETELTQIEDKYNNKKRKFVDSSEEFQQELKKYCAKVVDEEKFKEMVKEQVEKLTAEREERARIGAPTPPSPAVENDADKQQKEVKDDKMDTSEGGKNADDAEKTGAPAGTNAAVATPVANAGPAPTSAPSSEAPLQYATMANQKPAAPATPAVITPASVAAAGAPAPAPTAGSAVEAAPAAAAAPPTAAPVAGAPPAAAALAAAAPKDPATAPVVPAPGAANAAPAAGHPAPGQVPPANPAAPAGEAPAVAAPPPNVTAPPNYGPPPGVTQGMPPSYPPQQYAPQGGYPGYHGPPQAGYRPPHPQQQGGYPPYGGYPASQQQQHDQGYPPNPYPPQQQAMPPTAGAAPPPAGAVPAPVPQTVQPVPPPQAPPVAVAPAAAPAAAPVPAAAPPAAAPAAPAADAAAAAPAPAPAPAPQ